MPGEAQVSPTRPQVRPGCALRVGASLSGLAASWLLLVHPRHSVAFFPLVPCTVTPPVVPLLHVLRHLTLVFAYVCVYLCFGPCPTHPPAEATMVRGSFFPFSFTRSRLIAWDISFELPSHSSLFPLPLTLGVAVRSFPSSSRCLHSSVHSVLIPPFHRSPTSCYILHLVPRHLPPSVSLLLGFLSQH